MPLDSVPNSIKAAERYTTSEPNMELVKYFNSPGNLAQKWAFQKTKCNRIFFATMYFSEAPDQHTKIPKKSLHGKYANLHKSNMAANK